MPLLWTNMEWYGIKMRATGSGNPFRWYVTHSAEVFWAPKAVAEAQLGVLKEVYPEWECKIVRHGSKSKHGEE